MKITKNFYKIKINAGRIYTVGKSELLFWRAIRDDHGGALRNGYLH